MSVYLSNQPDPAAVEAALRRESVHIVLLAEFQFASGTVYTSNQLIPITTGGQTWQGFGDLVSVSAVSDSADTLAPLMEYSLGIPWELLTPEERATNGLGVIPGLIGTPSEYRGRTASLWEQVMSTDTLDEFGRPTPIGVPTALHSGAMDTPRASFTAATANLTLSVEGAFIRAGAPVYGRLTHRDQQRRFPGDKGLRYVPEVVDTEISWTDW